MCFILFDKTISVFDTNFLNDLLNFRSSAQNYHLIRSDKTNLF